MADNRNALPPRGILRVCLILAFVCGWYFSSISIVLTNRWAFGLKDGVNISPTVVTMLHMTIKTVLALLVCSLTCTGPGASGIEALRRRAAGQKLDKRIVLTLLLPLGTVTAMDVILSNYALQMVDVAAYTITKSTALAWTFGLSTCTGLLTPSWPLGVCVAALLLGVALCTFRASEVLNPLGIACAAGAAACGGSRWVITERYLSRPGVQQDVIALLGLMGPFTMLALLPPLLAELPSLIPAMSAWQMEDWRVLGIVVTGGGCMAFFLVMFELLLVRMTSALTLNVIGHAKDAVVIALAVLIFNEQLSIANWVGVVLTLLAATAYSRLRESGKGKSAPQSSTGSAGQGEAAVSAAVGRLSRSVAATLSSTTASPRFKSMSATGPGLDFGQYSMEQVELIPTATGTATGTPAASTLAQRDRMDLELPDVDTTRLGAAAARPIPGRPSRGTPSKGLHGQGRPPAEGSTSTSTPEASGQGTRGQGSGWLTRLTGGRKVSTISTMSDVPVSESDGGPSVPGRGLGAGMGGLQGGEAQESETQTLLADVSTS